MYIYIYICKYKYTYNCMIVCIIYVYIYIYITCISNNTVDNTMMIYFSEAAERWERMTLGTEEQQGAAYHEV